MTEQLKPCPCGGTAFLYTNAWDYGEDYGTECTLCCIHTPTSESKEKAMSDWNDHPMHKGEEIVRLQTGFIRIIHEVKAGATDVEVLSICREMLGFKEET